MTVLCGRDPGFGRDHSALDALRCWIEFPAKQRENRNETYFPLPLQWQDSASAVNSLQNSQRQAHQVVYCMRARAHAHTHTHTHTHRRTLANRWERMAMQTQTCMCKFIQTTVLTHAMGSLHTNPHTHTWTRTHARTHTHTHTKTHARHIRPRAHTHKRTRTQTKRLTSLCSRMHHGCYCVLVRCQPLVFDA